MENTETVSGRKKKAVNPEKEMTFWEHLEALRGHLVRSVIAILALSIVAFLNRELIFDGIILAPNTPDFPTNRFFCWIGRSLNLNGLCMETIRLKIINYSMAGQMMTHIKISFVAGIVLGTPYVFWELWRFLSPALKPRERKYSRGAVFVISFLFFLGVLFGYYVIVPFTVNFFSGYFVSQTVENQIALSSFIGTIVTSTLSTGLVFELPVVVFFLTRVGILTPAFLKRTRKYTFLIILILAAIVTPPDVFSQIVVTIPLYLLFEFSIWVAAKAIPKTAEPG